MKCPKFLAALLICISLFAAPVQPAHAAIDSMNLGASYNSQQTQITFRVYSANATYMVLYLYSAGYGVQESATYALSNVGNGVWQVLVPVSSIQAAGITGAVYYGYRAWGPNWPYSSSWTKGSSVGFVSDVDSNGNRFNPNKLLLDPYAREISQDPLNANNKNADIFASGATVDASFGVAYRLIDSGTYAPKGVVLAPGSQSTGTKPTRAQKDDVIYEVNVRGLTMQDPNTPSQYQGTYYGAGLKASYLASLGVTAVEFLPMQETQNDENDVIPDSTQDQNYWGYMTEDYFAPDRRYAYNKAPGGPTAEFQAMVQAFHNAGIKVYMDVVYNHTAEGGTWSSTDPTTATLFSWRGLDNATYYELTTGNQYFYDDTGTGGNFNTYNPVAQQMIIDSLAYWSTSMGVDGFRFDEAPILGNNCLNQSYESAAPNCPNGGFNFDASDPNIALNQILDNFTVRPAGGGSGLDLFAEPWSASGGDNQGQFPLGWSEWNGVFENTLRQAQNELGNMTISIGQDAQDFTGSSSIFQGNGRYPWNSTNYMDIHDGFTLFDVYYCNSPNNNQAWPYGPSSGGNTTNYSWNQGGAAEDQRRAARTGLAFTMLSAGTPIMAGGDEYLRSLNCNNNPYNVDSTANWLNYSWMSDQSNFYNFAQRAIAFRLAHPALRPENWYTTSQVEWWEPSGVQATTSYWDNTSNYAIAYTINGSSFGDSNSIYIAYNGWSGSVTFTLPPPPTGTNWYRVTDTCNWNDGPNTWVTPGNETLIGGSGATYSQCGQSLLLLISK
ncbi:alpha-amylase family glycosyl hydrolase [Dyella flava]|uniref:Glycogen-debranching protein n=1 Tax=Dyella flava TaxID=1920170 RepID=A0ABS2K0R3_9GAMM|nr:alpha-amylase family glycosyl hydrolase [Dyella flava]MBM7124832.1 glycogen-debranching protein [Dyella flava]GLQ50877.1 glycogen operon protein GlgX homolog [Dyella flava]